MSLTPRGRSVVGGDRGSPLDSLYLFVLTSLTGLGSRSIRRRPWVVGSRVTVLSSAGLSVVGSVGSSSVADSIGSSAVGSIGSSVTDSIGSSTVDSVETVGHR